MTDDNQDQRTETGIPVQARLMAQAGLGVLPIGQGTKYPPFQQWQNLATNNMDVLADWWSNGHQYGVGWKMGLQPDGRWLFAIDVDVKNDGKATFAALVKQFGLAAEINNAVTARTGGDGFHFVLELSEDPLMVPTTSKTTGGVDIRAEGGQIVVEPSVHPVTGKTYMWVAGKSPWELRPPVASVAMLAMLASMAPAPVPVRAAPLVPSLGGGDSAADYVREHFDWHTYLVKHGWSQDRVKYWVRPGKSAREGHSAELHDDGRLAIFTTDVPAEVARLGKQGAGGVLSISLFSFIAAYEFGGDESACGRWVRANYMESIWPSARAAVRGPDVTSLNLSAEFWTQRPVLTLIRDAAWARMASPDSLLAHALTRTATLVPPSYRLPAVVGGLATFDFLSCVVAETSGGKSLTSDVAKELMPDPAVDKPLDERQVMFDMPPGSGEGIAQAFMVPDTLINDDGKEVPNGKQKVGKQALHLVVDEGTGFTSMAGRPGTTIVSTLASAWSGQTFGNLNAAKETKRLIEGARVRVCCVINMQTSKGHLLFTDELSSVGFTGRLVFMSAHDPLAPLDVPDWPGPLTFPVPPSYGLTQTVFSYDPAIIVEIRQIRHAVLTQSVEIDKRRSQYLLLQCKVAALMAIWEGRRDVDLDDWALAKQVIDTSSRVLSHLSAIHEVQDEVAAVTAAEKRLRVNATAVTNTLAIGWKHKILIRLKRGPLPWKGLKDIVENGPHREHLRTALNEMIGEGVVTQDENRYSLP